MGLLCVNEIDWKHYIKIIYFTLIEHQVAKEGFLSVTFSAKTGKPQLTCILSKELNLSINHSFFHYAFLTDPRKKGGILD